MPRKNDLTGMPRLQRALPVLCIIVILAAGAGLRASVWHAWEKAPEQAFYNGSPVLRECDGYHYLGLARDMNERKAGRSDVVANDPEPFPYLSPLLSLLAATLSRVTGVSLEWCAAWIPVVLGTSAAIPLYLLAADVGGSWIAGAFAGLIGTMAPLWVYRSGFAFYDTDCLIVPLSLWIAWASLRIRERDMAKVLLFSTFLAGLGCLLYWSWDTNAIMVVYLSVVPIVLSLITSEGSLNRRKLWLLFSSGIILAAAIAIYGVSGLLQQIKILSDVVFVREKSPFPSPSLFLSELEKHDFTYIARMTSGSVVGFLVGVLGVVLILRKKWRDAIVLLPLASIGVLIFFTGQRFIIFLSPLLALGSGVLVSEVWQRFAASPWRWADPAAAGVITGLVLINQIPVGVIWPYVDPQIMEGIAKVGKLTPEGSLIWCGWSVGYPVAYESGRTPVADGGIGGNGQAVVANAIPFATDDFRLAANWIQFYANRGEQGLIDFWARSGGPAKKFDTLIEALAAGPSKAGQIIATAGLQEPPAGSRSWESFLFPQSNRRIFLFLEFSLLRSFDGWYRPGTWRPGHLRNDVAPYLVFQ